MLLSFGSIFSYFPASEQVRVIGRLRQYQYYDKRKGGWRPYLLHFKERKNAGRRMGFSRRQAI